jgi:hypothetical protein
MVAVRAPGKSIVAVAIARFYKNWGYQERNLSSGRTLASISIFNQWGTLPGGGEASLLEISNEKLSIYRRIIRGLHKLNKKI